MTKAIVLAGLLLFCMVATLNAFVQRPVFSGGSPALFSFLPLIGVLPLLAAVGGGRGTEPGDINVQLANDANSSNYAYSAVNATAFSYYS